MAKTNGGPPVNSPPVPGKEKIKTVRICLPIRPGETEFQVVFHLKYSGELAIDPRELYGAQHFVVMVPGTMQFTAAPGVTFQAMEDPRQSDALVRVVSDMRAGQPLNFRISGTGTSGRTRRRQSGSAPSHSGLRVPPRRPLRVSIPAGTNVPMALRLAEKIWWIHASGLALLLAAGVIYTKTRSASQATPKRSEISGVTQCTRSFEPVDVLLEELKNQLFQLEVEHKQGRISPPEYERARAALDGT